MALQRETLLSQLSRLGLDVGKIDDDTPIFSSGLLDSFILVEVIDFIEKETGRKMKARDVHLDNLDTVNRILAYANGR